MSKYYDALNRTTAKTEEIRQLHPPRAKVIVNTQGLSQRSREIVPPTGPLIEKSPIITVAGVEERSGLLAVPDLPSALARQSEIRQLCERIAPAAAVEECCRIGISGCRSRDGASSVAAALALDLSQRLRIRTLLIDANLKTPGLHRLITNGDRRTAEMTLDGAVQLRATGWSRLMLATCGLEDNDAERDPLMAKLEPILRTFPAVVIDLGVARLDPRLLPLLRPTDPTMVVVRYGQTHRKELATTVAALRTANRTIAGVILNAKPVLLHSSSGENSVYE
jgi:Mrp family chromosome partitioning ATPase